MAELVGVRKQSLNYVDASIAAQYQLSGAGKAQDKNEEGKDDAKKDETAS